MAIAAVQTIRRLFISEAKPVGYDKLAADVNKVKGAQDSLNRTTDTAVKNQLSAARAVNTLRMQLDPAYAATVKFTRGQELLNRALRQGSIDAATHARQLDLLEKKYLQAGAAQGRMSRMGALGAGFVGGIAGGLATQAVMSVPRAIGSSVEDLARIQDVADRIGASTDRIQEFRFAVEQSGGSLEDADTALQNFATRSGDAANKTGDLYKLFKANNVAIKDANTNLKNFANLIAGAKDEQQAMAIAADGFGKGVGREVVVALRNGSMGLDDFAKAARAAGVIIDTDLVKKIAGTDDEMVKLRASISGVSNSLIAEFGAPALLAVLSAFSGWLTGIKTTMDGIRAGGFTTPIPEVQEAVSRAQSPNFRVNNAVSQFDQMGGAVDQFYNQGPARATITKQVARGSTIMPPSSTAKTEAEKNAEATKRVIEALQEEQRQLTMTDEQKRISNELSAAKTSATTAEGAAIRQLVIDIEAQKQALAQVKAAYDYAANTVNDFFQNMIFNGQSAKEALSGILKTMASELLKFGITGQGAFSSIFGATGGATGGTGGLFGILGKGIFGGAAAAGGGTLGGGTMTVNINGAVGNSEVRGLVAEGVARGISGERKSLRDKVTGTTRDNRSRRIRMA